ncbi:MAG: response regulator transcription factor [Coleofasciculaceae cyanobacterium SM2_1_6]|nr:response regulator transcription factor [Coleofasciculaceae cyanobacterium SM2_1_6]
MPLLILVADDDPGVQVAVCDYLEMAGYQAIAVDNGRSAMNLLEKYHPQLLITDINMPQMDGYQLVREVRTRPEYRLLPVVFLTERGSTVERIRGYQMGCDAYLPKPFEMPELGAILRNLLERSQLIQTEWRYQQSLTKPPEPERVVSPETIMAADISIEISRREQEVLELLTTGLSNSEIGNHLHLSSRTVEKYVSSLLRKTTTNNRSELLRFALQHKLVN